MLWIQIKKDIPDLFLIHVSIFTAIDSKSKGSIFNTYYDSWPSVRRYTYIIAIAREPKCDSTCSHAMCVKPLCFAKFSYRYLGLEETNIM